MGLATSSFSFATSVPRPEAIAERARQICGLTVDWEPMVESAKNQSGSAAEFEGWFQFRGFASTKLHASTSQKRMPRRAEDETVGADGYIVVPPADGDGTHAEGSPAVELELYLGQEPTLFLVLRCALEDLGGKRDLPGDSAHADDPEPRLALDETELRQRLRLAEKQARAQLPFAVMMGFAYLVTLPFVLAIAFFQMLWWLTREGLRDLRR